jgi:hypothetical protein
MVKLLNLLFRLRRLGPINDIAVALMLTESRFRTLPARIVECLMATFKILVIGKDPNLTMGKCQVSFRFWRARFGANTIELLRSTFDDVASYQVCCDYLKTVADRPLHELLTAYNGRPSALYAKSFQDNLMLVQSVRAIQERRILERMAAKRELRDDPAR